MSIAQFGQSINGVIPRLERLEVKLDALAGKIPAVRNELDALTKQAEAVGSAVGQIGGTMVEVVSLNQSNWTPALEGVVWQLYEVQKAAEKTEVVSRDVLDKISNLVDERMPNFELWLKKILQMRADGELTLDEMQQKIDDFATSVGVTQLNSMYHNDIPGFIIEFRKLMDEVKRGEKTLDEAGAALDEVTGKAKKAAAEVRNVTGGMTSGTGGTPGAMGSASGASGQGGSMTAATLATAIQTLRGRTS